MLRWIVLVLALASCDQVFQLSGRDDVDARVNDDGDTNNDATTDGGRCEISTVDPLGDYDGDGIKNQNDSCPTIADSGHNEDDDCAADACDLCPQFPADSADSDGDDIGADCDFAGTIDIRRFDAFDNADELIRHGMQIDGLTGSLETTAVAGPGAYGWSNLEIPSSFMIETTFKIPVAGADWNAGLIFGGVNPVDPTPDAWAVTVSRLNGAITLRVFMIANGSWIGQNADQGVKVDGEKVRLRVTVVGTTVSVTTSSGGLTGTSIVVLPSALPAATSYGVAAFGDIRTSFEYLYETHAAN